MMHSQMLLAIAESVLKNNKLTSFLFLLVVLEYGQESRPNAASVNPRLSKCRNFCEDLWLLKERTGFVLDYRYDFRRSTQHDLNTLLVISGMDCLVYSLRELHLHEGVLLGRTPICDLGMKLSQSGILAAKLATWLMN